MTLQLNPLVNVRPIFFLLNPSKHLFHGRPLFKLYSCNPIKGLPKFKNSLNCLDCTQLILLKHLAWVASDLSKSCKEAQPSSTDVGTKPIHHSLQCSYFVHNKACPTCTQGTYTSFAGHLCGLQSCL